MLAACLAYLLAFILRVVVPFPLTQGYLPAVRFSEVNHHWPEMLLAQVATLYFLGLYETRAVLRPRSHVVLIVAGAALQALILIAVYFFRQDLVFPRSIFVVFASLNALLLLVWRLGCSALLGGYPRRRVLVVGTNATASEVIAAIAAQQWLGLDVVGVVASNPNGTRRAALDGVPVLGRREEVPALCTQHDIDEVIIASDATWQDELLDAFSRTPRMRSRVSVVPSPFEILIGRRETLRLHDIPLIEVLEDVPGGGAVTKRLFDTTFAVILLVVTAPIMLLVALAVRLTSRGAVIYRQRRVGRGGVPFTILKFRTMRDEAEMATGPVLATKDDPRVTPLGRLLRATRLDELPQLWNVLRGDMSFVGPRPERPEFVEGYQSGIQGYVERFRVRPGLTGYAQVNGEYHTSAATKLKYDLAYLYNRSLWLDLKILSSTVKVMITRRGV